MNQPCQPIPESEVGTGGEMLRRFVTGLLFYMLTERVILSQMTLDVAVGYG